VIGTGDFTHPGWFAEIKEKLAPAEPGLFKLKDKIAKICDKEVPVLCRSKVRFLLSCEISNIYKKDGKVRKNHNLIFMPNLEKAESFNKKLDKIGNIKSDGRPILGLDAKNLLEIMLDTSNGAFFIPAHIWTPWFSVMGSKSGFDSIEECFEDLTPHIFAVETGLSSDPPMNWRVSALDGLTLISNSDAHSPMKLGREANLFNTDLSYYNIRSAIKEGDKKRFLGTFEFFPQEGKYHLDGHRKCNIRFLPKETIKNKGICPVCLKPLTLGVLYRVEELADQPENIYPEQKNPFYSIIPLTEILSEILKVGAGSKRVKQKYNDLLEKLGPELKILHEITYESLGKSGIPLLGEAIKRVRAKQITLLPGYDGEFGKVKIFTQEEREKLSNQQSLFIYRPSKKEFNKKEGKKTEKQKKRKQSKTEKKKDNITSTLNKDQKKAVLHKKGPLIIMAGPGTGKTRTLTHRIAHLVKDNKVLPENILAVTFTNKAAVEMRERLEILIKGVKELPLIATFHSLCFKILQEQKNIPKLSIIDDDERKSLVLEALKDIKKKGITINEKPQVFLDKVVYAKQQIIGPDDYIKDITGEKNAESFPLFYKVYQNLLATQKHCDFEDLIYMVVKMFENNDRIRKKYTDRFKFLFVDEYQDVNHGQYRIIKALAPPDSSNNNLCIVGDPNQSIYGFRGSDVKYFDQFTIDYNDAKTITLTKNYRSTETILEASYQIIKNRNMSGSAEETKNSKKSGNFARRVYSQIEGLKKIIIIERSTEKAESESVSRAIEQMIGGTGHHSIDTGRVKEPYSIKERSFSDFAVLYRTKSQNQSILDVFDKRGIPVQIVSKDKIFNKKHIKQSISLLKIIEGVGSYIDVERVNKVITPGISRQTVDIFKSWSKKSKFSLKKAVMNSARFPLPEMSRQRQINFRAFMDSFSRLKKEMKGMTVEKKLLYITENTKLKATAKNSPESKDAFNKLIDISKNHGNNTDEFFTATALQTDTDTYYPQAERVSLMTMHAAKGLEFPVVFITGCEKGYIPFERGEDKESDINEERRLFYVAMTRAKEKLYLTRAKKRRIFGKAVSRDLSPFVEDIEKRLRTHEAPVLKKKKKNKHVQLELF
ncbi:MAG: UvrD-helicase domain-containing protein, partial [Desulfobacterales bacterium]|nr:UvrD-helicase domain-containing protein [Desulfobacterales bacterium]MDX2509716.1 UvrD-helicase domain-containing protein [Desulfobacterales bacterium]